MIEQIRNSKVGVIGVGIVVLILLILILTPFNGIQFIVLALVPGICVLASFLGKLSFQFRKYDILWGIFIALGMCSLLWATNVSFVWNPLFIWIASVGFMICLRSLLNEGIMLRVITYVLYVVFAITLFHQMLAIHYEISIDKSWNEFLFKNSYYTTVFLLSMYPFLLFAELKGRFVRFFKLISGAMIVNILLITEARAAALAFGLMLLYFFYSRMKLKLEINTKVLIGILVLMLTAIVIVTAYQSDIAAAIYGADHTSRLGLLNQTMKLFMSRPISGAGLGNWMIESYQYASVNPNNAVRLPSHNQFLEKFSELGFIGGLIFTILILYPIAFVIKKGDQLPWRQKAACGTLIVYAITSLFYADVNSHNQHFSAIQLLAFVSLALVSLNMDNGIPWRSFVKFLIVVSSILCIAWFTYIRHQHRMGSAIFQKDDISIEMNEKIQNVYHPVWNTHFNGEVSYSLWMGTNNISNREFDLAQKHLNQALLEDPYNLTVQAALNSISD